jgi:hypothetical protein
MSSNRNMNQRPGLLPIFVFLVAGSVFGQIGFPGISRTSTKNPVTTVNGILRRITDDDLVLQTDDKVIIKVALGITTKYYKASGAMIKGADLQPGDRLTIDATQEGRPRLPAREERQPGEGGHSLGTRRSVAARGNVRGHWRRRAAKGACRGGGASRSGRPGTAIFKTGSLPTQCDFVKRSAGRFPPKPTCRRSE